MSRLTPEGQGHKKLGANRFGVATQGIYVATIARLLKENYVATSTKYVPTQIKNKPREKVTTKKEKLRQRKRQRLEVLSRHNFLCRNKETNLGQNFGDPQCN